MQRKSRCATARITPKLHAELKRRARAEKKTLSEYMELLLIAATVATETGLPPASELRKET